MFSGFAIVWQQRAEFLSGLLTTLAITSVAGIFAIAFGVLIFSALISSRRTIRLSATSFVDVLRCVPFMLFCYLLYYALPYAGVTLGNLTVGVMSLAIYHACYIAELLRGAWQGLPRDSIESGKAFGFHGLHLMRIILPPVIITALPTLGSAFIQIIKDSAFLVIIAVQELTYAANEIQSTFYVPFASFITAVIFYWGLCLIVEGGVHILSSRMAIRR